MTEDIEKIQLEAERAVKELLDEAKQIPLKHGLSEEASTIMVALAVMRLFYGKE